jgi:protein involved in polysaccharide export with SLBB domain
MCFINKTSSMKNQFFFSLLLFIFLASAQSNSQIDYSNITGAKKGEIDTVAFEVSQHLVKQSSGLLEQEIDPDEYILGPNDILTISILSAKPKTVEAIISPDGSIIIPGIGSIDLRNSSLTEAREKIADLVRKYLKVDDCFASLSKMREFKVIVSGAVRKPSIVPATAVDRVSEVIEKAGGFSENASIRSIKILRDNQEKSIFADMMRFFALADKDANPKVLGGDHILVFPKMETEKIELYGEVPQKGSYEYTNGDSLSTLLKFGYGFLESSYLDSVEFARFSKDGKIVNRSFLDLREWRERLYSGEKLPNDFPLQSGDRVYIRKIPDWKKDFYVAIYGEVKFPGLYAINENEVRLSTVLQWAGGFKEDAGIESAVLVRQQELEVEDKEMERLRRIPMSEMSKNERRYFEARVAEQRGVMAINFKNILEDEGSSENILILNKDSIFVPKERDFVNVQGRVNNPGMITYNPNFNYMDYIKQAGGFGFRADDDETFIVKSKGQQFLAKKMNYQIESGDYILVPPEPEITFFEIFTTSLTIATQLMTIFGVVFTIINLKN